MSTRFKNTYLIILFVACVATTALTLLAQSLPPFAGFGSTKQPLTQGTDEEKLDLDDVAAKRAWLFLEYPQLALVPEPPARGTFYSLQKVQPPLPFLPIEGLPIYSWADGNFFYDDLEVNYSPLRSSANRLRSGGVMKMDSPGVPGGGGGGTNETVGGYSGPPAYSYTNSADLWIEIVPNLTTNGTATNFTLKIHNTLAGIYYDALGSTNLAVTNGWFVLGGVLATNDVSVLPDPVWPTNNAIQFFLARASGLDTDGDGLPDWWELKNSLDPFSADTGGTGTIDGYKNPAGDGWANLEKYRSGWSPGTFYTPAAPANFKLTVQTNGFVQLFWDRALGNPTGYVLEVNTGSGFTTLATLGSTTNNFLDTSAPVSATYRVKATYGGGNSEYTPILSNLVDDRLTLNARIVRGPLGRLYVVTSALPSLVTKVRISRTVSGTYYPFDNYFFTPNETPYSGLFYPSVTNGVFDLALTNFVNGVCLIPTNQVPAYGYYDVQVTGVGSDGRQGNWSDSGYILAIPFQDGSAQMKQNVSFILRAPRADQPFGFTAYWGEVIGGTLYQSSEDFGWPADYAQSGLHRSYYDTYQYLNEFRPFEENRYFRNFSQPLNSFLSSGVLDSGLLPDGYVMLITNRPVHFFNSYSYVVNSNQAAIATALSYTNSQWIFAGYQTFNSTANESGLYVNGAGKLTLASSFHNYFGLPIQSVKVKSTSGSFVTLNPGDQLTGWADSYVYQQAAEPSLETVGYYFERVASDTTSFLDSFPGTADFSITNTTPILIASVGQPIQFAGWAKQRIVNGYTNQFTYLGQYFDKAFTTTNGAKTTNQTGILSEYGEFLPTEPGRVILTTKSDPDQTTNQVGEALVHVIGLNVDANHDGTMDRTFIGPDQTSAQKPFRFWVNDDHDNGDDDIYDGQPDYQDGLIANIRDLEDFARLWITGVPTNQDLTVNLSWRNATGQPAIKIYRAVESDGGIEYLTNSTVAGTQKSYANEFGSYVGSGVTFGIVATNQGLTFSATNFATFGRKHFLFEGAGIGEGELVLSVKRSDVTIGETSLFIRLRKATDMFEQTYATTLDGQASVNLVKALTPVPSETPQLLVFVHGINNTEPEYEAAGSTFFKRLYWLGYQGRFAAFRWDCPLLPECGYEIPRGSPFNFNLGESTAYQSSQAFKSYLTNVHSLRLTNYNISIVAHSLGNGVVSAALAAGAPFDNYILSQGAIPAHCYDVQAPFLQKFLDEEAGNPTPFYRTNGGYHGCFTNITGNVVSLYNTNDYALVSGSCGVFSSNWEAHQLSYKPFPFTGPYTYDGTNSYRAGVLVTNLYESRAFVARSRSRSVGSQGGIGGIVDSSYDLKSSLGFTQSRGDHSGQFTRDIQTVLGYYSEVLSIIEP